MKNMKRMCSIRSYGYEDHYFLRTVKESPFELEEFTHVYSILGPDSYRVLINKNGVRGEFTISDSCFRNIIDAKLESANISFEIRTNDDILQAIKTLTGMIK